MSISFINHKGKKILYIDYTKCKTTAEMLKVLEMAKMEYQKSNDMFLTINDFTGTSGSPEYMSRVKQLGKEIFNHRTSKSAVLGITGIKKILLNAYSSIVKRNIAQFETKAEALEYLVK